MWIRKEMCQSVRRGSCLWQVQIIPLTSADSVFESFIQCRFILFSTSSWWAKLTLSLLKQRLTNNGEVVCKFLFRFSAFSYCLGKLAIENRIIQIFFVVCIPQIFCFILSFNFFCEKAEQSINRTLLHKISMFWLCP